MLSPKCEVKLKDNGGIRLPECERVSDLRTLQTSLLSVRCDGTQWLKKNSRNPNGDPWPGCLKSKSRLAANLSPCDRSSPRDRPSAERNRLGSPWRSRRYRLSDKQTFSTHADGTLPRRHSPRPAPATNPSSWRACWLSPATIYPLASLFPSAAPPLAFAHRS